MMTFCRKSVHSLLSFTTNTTATNHHRHHDDGDDENHHNHHNLIINPSPSPKCSKLGLISLITDPKTINDTNNSTVLESSSLIAAKPSPAAKKNPGGIGFIDDIGGGVDGLMSCTESLGFESSDERRADDDADGTEFLSSSSSSARNDDNIRCNDGARESYGLKRSRRRRTGTEAKKFPPPLPSLDRNGRPSFFLRPVRKDGRLELTEVRINRPEILRAYRGDGRLRLHLIRDEEEDGIGDDFGYNISDDLDSIHEEQEIVQEDGDDRLISINNNNYNNNNNINNNNSGEGFRRCHEEVNQNDNLHHHHHHHHHQNHLWRAQRHCVITTR